jgi:hypothetical protein
MLEINKAVKVRTGNLGSAVGVLLELNAEKKTAKVRINGIFDGKPVDITRWFKLDQLEEAS